MSKDFIDFYGKNIINESMVFKNLEPALQNVDYVIATSAIA